MAKRKLFRHTHEGKESYFFYCPGCKCGHHYEVPRWTFNGNVEKPSFSPSLLMFTTRVETGERKTECHLFLTDGRITYCGDCPHPLSGKTIEMVEFPENYEVPGEAVG